MGTKGYFLRRGTMANHDCELIIENFPIGFVYLETEFSENGEAVDFTVSHINKEFEQLFSIDRNLFLHKKLSEVVKTSPFSQPGFISRPYLIAQSQDTVFYNKYNELLNKWFKISVYHSNNHQVALFFSDITQSIQPYNELNILFNIASDLITISDMEGKYIQVNRVYSKVYGYNLNEVINNHIWDFAPKEEHNFLIQIIKQLNTEDKDINYTTQLIHKNGNYSFIEWSSQRQGNRIYSVGRDVSERIIREKEIEYLSFHDVLTGLLNRRFLEEEMKRLDTNRNLPISLIMCDVNRLKLINDAFGHEEGDQLIKYAAKTLKESCRPDDLVARWGGDEFILFLPKTNYTDALKIVQRINYNSSKYEINSLALSIACGICTKENDELTIQDLLRNSEDAMYREKSIQNERNRKDMIGIIAQALYERCPQEEEHAKRVSILCRYLASALKCSKEDIQKSELAGLFHDIGKVAINSEILLKESQLNEKEWQIIRQHTEIGSKVVGENSDYKDISKAILHHHERFDGNGYPSGMKWDEIPLISRIISLSESFDTIFHKTNPNDSIECVIKELRKNKGTQFDPFITEIFIKDVVEKLYQVRND